MKKVIYAALVWVVLQPTHRVWAQQPIKELPSGYLMTVAAYLSTGEGYAQRYVKKLREQGYQADYGFTYPKNMYFVYIKKYDDLQTAVSEINKTRRETPFKDAWVYAYKAREPQSAAPPLQEPDDASQPQAPPPAPVDTIQADTSAAIVQADSMEAAVQADTAVQEPVVTEPPRPKYARLIHIDAAHVRTGEPVEAEFLIYDPFNEQVLTTMKSGETKWVNPPANEQKIARIATSTIGWKKDEVNVSFINPVTDSTEYFASLQGDTLVLYFEMHRLRKGDIQTLYNVYFFNQSSIMRPESKFQLDELLAMLKENPKYRIMLHGHTNGKAPGEYIRLAQNDTLFFKLSSVHERTSGSAKALSLDRAQTVRQYLISKGIAPERIEVKGWGGKHMLYDENSPAARRNIRVEVEVLADQ